MSRAAGAASPRLPAGADAAVAAGLRAGDRARPPQAAGPTPAACAARRARSWSAEHRPARCTASTPSGELPIACTTKLMTALLMLEHVHRLSRRCSPQNDYYPAAADSQIGLVPGRADERPRPAAGAAAAERRRRGRGPRLQRRPRLGRALRRDDERARPQLGLRHTHYSTPIGLDTPGNYSSAADLVKLAQLRADPQPLLRARRRAPAGPLHTGSHVRLVVNRNDLVGRVPVDQRRQDRPHARRRLRAGRLGHAGRDDAAQRRARDRRARRRATTNTLALLRLRLRELPPRRRRSGPAPCSPGRRSRTSPACTRR